MDSQKKKSRRKFITNISAYASTVGFSTFFSSSYGKTVLDVIESKQKDGFSNLNDDEFWKRIKQAYTVSPSIMNLNNGGVSPAPKVVQEAVEHYNRILNELPSLHMYRTVGRGKETVRRKLAALAGCSVEEIAIHRNATESLETVVFGLKLEKGDEVVLSKYDYPSMINAWKQRELRDGIVLKYVDFDFPMEDKSLIVNAFKTKFSKKTKVVQVTQMINWTGQILPVKEIAQAAKSVNAEVLVDGAHTFCQLDFSIPDLECDYFGTSLHKWLCAPFGTGMLYVKKSKIASLFPLFAAEKPESDDIRKFEHIGTRSTGVEQAIAHAIDFHNLIGTAKKQERLFYLKNYWAEQLKDHPRIRLKTSLKKDFGGAIALFEIDGMDKMIPIVNKLYTQHQIHTVAINREAINGIRVTPNVYTLESDLDRFVEVIKKMI